GEVVLQRVGDAVEVGVHASRRPRAARAGVDDALRPGERGDEDEDGKEPQELHRSLLSCYSITSWTSCPRAARASRTLLAWSESRVSTMGATWVLPTLR